MKKRAEVMPPHRLLVLGALLVGMGALLVWRAVDLHVFNKDFLQEQGDARSLRVVGIPAHRGMILDRSGEPLAISTPVESVWAHPGELLEARAEWKALAAALELTPRALERILTARADRAFVYLRRHVTPETARKVLALNIPGVATQREYRRYYPVGEVAAHVIGFTNIDDVGQEGLELAYNEWLRGTPGGKRVIKDRLGRVVENLGSISEPHPGKDLVLSLDQRIQYLAYRELKSAVRRHRALSGSAVVLDARTGEVLAMVNQPAFNPNNRSGLQAGAQRNRAVTDLFEPGSSVKPFTVAAALESGGYGANTAIDTGPGYLRVAGGTVRDIRNYGRIDLTTVITKSSNVGASKIAMALDPSELWGVFDQVGLGRSTLSGFPGEKSGLLNHFSRWQPIDRATFAFGYGLSVTALQLAQAYAVLAADGVQRPISFVRLDDAQVPAGRRVLRADTARAVRTMMETVVHADGTGPRARVPGYRVAGKTGTVKKVGPNGYSEDRYQAIFAGMVPARNPRLVMVVTIDEPRGEAYYGGQVAAPVFAEVMAGALRLLDIAPDALPEPKARVAYAEDER